MTNTTIQYGSFGFEKALIASRAFGEVTLRMDVTNAPCPFCGEMALTQDAAFSNGLEIVHYDFNVVADDSERGYHLEQGAEMFRYQPRLGEVVKNHYMECSKCGNEQAS